VTKGSVPCPSEVVLLPREESFTSASSLVRARARGKCSDRTCTLSPHARWCTTPGRGGACTLDTGHVDVAWNEPPIGSGKVLERAGRADMPMVWITCRCNRKHVHLQGAFAWDFGQVFLGRFQRKQDFTVEVI